MPTVNPQESSRVNSRGLSRLSITACLRCRDQKLKCGREHPICARCNRLNTTCVYPDPPDRRGPRAKRKERLLHRTAEHSLDGIHSRHSAIQHPCTESISQEASTNREQTLSSPPTHRFEENASTPSHAGTGGASTTLAAGTPVLSDSYPTQLRRVRSVARESTLDSDQPPLPPIALGLSLLEIYFARIYNASVLFYKPVLFQEYLEGRIHGALLRALFALATLFLRPRVGEKECVTDEIAELKVLSVYHSCGLPWAKAALREAVPLAMESPSLMIVQALECIQLYWFGVGQPHSGNLCLALAYRSCQMLGFDRKLSNENDGFGGSFESELCRRCFWACWTSTCIVMEPEPYIESAWKEVAMLPLPGSISSVSSGCEVSFNQMMNEDWQSFSVRSPSTDSQPPTAVGILVKIIGVWAKVQLLCKGRSSSAAARKFNSTKHLSGLATSLFNDAAAVRNSVCQEDKSPEAQILLLHDAIYHQCQITLHSMIVPLFSGIPTDQTVDTEIQRKAAETVIHHADLFEGLLAPYLYDRMDASRLPPLVGYGAFIVGIVFLSTEFSRLNPLVSRQPVSTDKKGRRLVAVEAIINLLDSLRVYWRALEHPWEILNTALQAGFSAPRKPSKPTDTRDNEPLACSNDHPPSTTLEGFDQPINSENGHPQPSIPDIDVREHIEETQLSPTSRNNDGGGLDGLVEMVPNESVMNQIDMLPDSEWYNLSFAEAGVGQFTGLETSNLFQQGWRTFS